MVSAAATARLSVPTLWDRAQQQWNVLAILTWIGIFVAWEIVGRLVSPVFLSYPSAVAAAFVKLLLSGDLLEALAASGKALVIGFALGAVAGLALGMLMGRLRLAEYAIDTYVSALYATPTIAYLPLIILWMGLTEQTRVAIVFLAALFPVAINTQVGARDISQSLMDVGQAFAANKRQQFTKIIMWATLPYMATGLRLALGRAISAVIVAEFLIHYGGLGYLIQIFAGTFRTAELFAPIIVLMAMGIVLSWSLRYLEDKLAPWKATERAQV
ncbi:MAG: ABC transporter permease [Dehalococcoidia bacterium]|nr:ABC transporter permease [Dehalococcoidia bacterium]